MNIQYSTHGLPRKKEKSENEKRREKGKLPCGTFICITFFLPKCFDGLGDHFGTSLLLRFLFVSLSLGALSA